jgi:uncharacterized protein YjbJ (UPF0337 family)
MDQNRIGGVEKKLEGNLEEGVGRVLGDAKTAAQGRLKQAAGATQDMYGQAKDSAAETVGSLEAGLRDYIVHNPFTAAAIALGLGWLLGRSHRPL